MQHCSCLNTRCLFLSCAECDVQYTHTHTHTHTQLGDYVTALHPDYAYSYAPGQIAGIAADGLHFTVDLYDGSQTVLPRQEVYSLPESKHDSDVQYLKMKEQEWVGVACIARKDSDGLYYPGKSCHGYATERVVHIRLCF